MWPGPRCKGYTATPEKNGAAAGRGRSLRIEGGDYKLYDENEKIYGCGRCRRQTKPWSGFRIWSGPGIWSRLRAAEGSGLLT